MTTEQKAKAYDEAIKKAKDMLYYKEVRQEDMEYLFPKLAESEDEYWQDVRERAAIAAMGQLIGMGRDDGYKYSPSEVANYAVVYANELIEELKKK